jgi:hypothetical protein
MRRARGVGPTACYEDGLLLWSGKDTGLKQGMMVCRAEFLVSKQQVTVLIAG